MFNIHIINYMSLSKEKAKDLFSLRKATFADRLGWAVTSENGLERDVFDGIDTNYVLGIMNEEIICGTRLIAMSNKNMLESAFAVFFKNAKIPPGCYVESTRFFVDKKRAKELLGYHYPVTLTLFLSLINFAQQHDYDGIIAVASHAMMHIIRQSGWHVTILDTGLSEKNEPVYLLLGHVDYISCKNLKEKILTGKNTLTERLLDSWPLVSKDI
ncbi:acyl-homoserine-lactone synthase [Kalamiella sp. sgz302252]|uniref:acyl-homoserine-lactone synthase n=1 Tax=Pantoea sp. sgz302252 TaxID=3341827 RepID=UPI0036D3AA5E